MRSLHPSKDFHYLPYLDISLHDVNGCLRCNVAWHVIWTLKKWIEFLQNSGIRPPTYRQNITPIGGLRIPHKVCQLAILSKLLDK
jgi:hypothetical protein